MTITRVQKLVRDFRKSRELVMLSIGLGLSTICTAFFMIDIVGDLFFDGNFPGGRSHRTLELIVVIVSLSAFVYHVRELGIFLKKHQRIQDQMRVASGQFAEVIEELFTSWQLTLAEQDVALFLVKGLSFKEIAAARDAKEGTAKAQANAIYRKASVSGRHELIALFLDELLQDIEIPAESGQNEPLVLP